MAGGRVVIRTSRVLTWNRTPEILGAPTSTETRRESVKPFLGVVVPEAELCML